MVVGRERAKRPKLVKSSADSRRVEFTQVGRAGWLVSDLAMFTKH